MAENDEIDLLDLFRKLQDKVKGLFKSIGNYLVFCLKKAWIFILIAGLVGLIGYFFYDLNPTYSSRTVLSSNYIANELTQEIVGNITAAVDEENDAFLKENNLSSCIENLTNIECLPFYGDEEDSLYKSGPFIIRYTAKDGSTLPKIEEEVLAYLMKNPYLMLNHELAVTRKEKQLVSYNEELKALDSLRGTVKNFDNITTSGGNNAVVPYIDPTIVSSKHLAVTQSKITTEVALMNTEVYRIVVHNSIKLKPDVSGKKGGFIWGVLVAFVASIVLFNVRQKYKILQ